MGSRSYPLEVQLVSICPNNSNRVLEVINITNHPPSVMVSAHTIFSCGQNHLESMVSMSVASSINQFPSLHRDRLSHSFIWPSWSIISSKVSWCLTTHIAAPYSPCSSTRDTATNQYATSTSLLLQPYQSTLYSSITVYSTYLKGVP